MLMLRHCFVGVPLLKLPFLSGNHLTAAPCMLVQTPMPMTFSSASFAAMVNAAMAGGGGAQQAGACIGSSGGRGRGSSGEHPGAPPERSVEALQDALHALPAARHVEMLLIKEELDNTQREAAAADAAVAAVAKVRAAPHALPLEEGGKRQGSSPGLPQTPGCSV